MTDIVPLFYTDRTDVDLQPIKDHCIERAVIIGRQTKKQSDSFFFERASLIFAITDQQLKKRVTLIFPNTTD